MPVTLILTHTDARDCVVRTSQLAEVGAMLHTLCHPWHHHPSGGLIATANAELSPDLLTRIRSWSPVLGPQRARFLLPMDRSTELSLDDELDQVATCDLDTFMETCANAITETTASYSACTSSGRRRIERDLLVQTSRLSETRCTLAQRLVEDPERCRTEVTELLADAAAHPVLQREWNQVQPLLTGEAMRRQAELQRHGPSSLAALPVPVTEEGNPHRLVFDKLYHAVARIEDSALVVIPSVHVRPHVVVKHLAGFPVVVHYPIQAGESVPFELLTRRLQALNNPVRIQICRNLLREPRATVDLALALQMPDAQVSRHLRVLREAGLVIAERSGRLVRYRLDSAVVNRLGTDFIETLIR